MTRELPLWKGATPDTKVPMRVRLRVFMRYGGRCDACGRYLRPGVKWEIDHRIPLINGGENSEPNLVPLCAEPCHADKTKRDIAAKSVTYRKRLAHHGMRKRKGRPMAGTRASGIRRRMDGTVERW